MLFSHDFMKYIQWKHVIVITFAIYIYIYIYDLNMLLVPANIAN